MSGSWELLISNQQELLQQQLKPNYLRNVRVSDFFLKSCRCAESLRKSQISFSFESCLVLGRHYCVTILGAAILLRSIEVVSQPSGNHPFL